MVPVKRGRPSQYTDDLADRICDLLSRGVSLNEICESGKYPEMPGLVTVFNWLRDPQKTSFLHNYTRAKENSADAYAAMLVDAAKGPFNDMLEVNAARLKIDTLKWVASKLKPKSYGDRVQAQLTGADGGAIKVQSVPVDPNEIAPEVREALRAALIASTAGGSSEGDDG